MMPLLASLLANTKSDTLLLMDYNFCFLLPAATALLLSILASCFLLLAATTTLQPTTAGLRTQ